MQKEPSDLTDKEVKVERQLNLLKAPVNRWCLGTAQSTNHTTLCIQAAGFHFILSFCSFGGVSSIPTLDSPWVSRLR